MDDNEKKDTKTNGAKRKNKYPNDTMFNSISKSYYYIVGIESKCIVIT